MCVRSSLTHLPMSHCVRNLWTVPKLYLLFLKLTLPSIKICSADTFTDSRSTSSSYLMSMWSAYQYCRYVLIIIPLIGWHQRSAVQIRSRIAGPCHRWSYLGTSDAIKSISSIFSRSMTVQRRVRGGVGDWRWRRKERRSKSYGKLFMLLQKSFDRLTHQRIRTCRYVQ